MTLWLIGMMGSGKTTAGRIAAEIPEFEIDTSSLSIEEVAGRIERSWPS
jgi:shikimate kinase